ncbi:MAG: Sec-independent protein translocase subunit TatA/TatB [bacterium]
MSGVGGHELLLIFFVVLLVFGPKRIPEVARGLAQAIRQVRRLTTELQRDLNLADALEEERPSPKAPAAKAADPDPDDDGPPRS